jgi:hypothetical protein
MDVQTASGISRNAVLSLSRNVNRKIKAIDAQIIRSVLEWSGDDNQPPNKIGMTGRTQGAKTERIPAKNEIRIIVIERKNN